MRIEVQVDISEIVWEDDPYGFFSVSGDLTGASQFRCGSLKALKD